MYNYDGNKDSPTYDHREELKKVILTFLGMPQIDVELSDDQLELAIDLSIQNYNSHSSKSKEEAFLHLKMLQNESVYILPQEVQLVRKIYRRGNGVVAGSGSTVDPFSLAYSNTYLLSAVRGATGGGLLTYDLYYQFDETVGRLFGREIMFTWNSVTKKLILERDVRADEEVLLHVYQQIPEGILFKDEMSYPIIRDWAIAEAMYMLGRIRVKFASMPGPQGQWQTDGQELIQESQQMKEQITDRLKKYGDGATPLTFIIG